MDFFFRVLEGVFVITVLYDVNTSAEDFNDKWNEDKHALCKMIWKQNISVSLLWKTLGTMNIVGKHVQTLKIRNLII